MTQRGVVGCASLPLLAAEAKARQGERTDLQPPGNLAPKSRKATDEAAAAVGVSGRTVAKSAAIAKSAPDLYAAMRSGLVTLEQATVLAKLPEPERAPLIEDIRAAPTIEARERTAKHAAKGAKERHKANVVAEIEARPPPPATGPFRVIAIDPPWQYDKRPDDVTHRARLDYRRGDRGDLGAPVAELAEEDCVRTDDERPHTAQAPLSRRVGFRKRSDVGEGPDGVGDYARANRALHPGNHGRPVNLTRETTLLTAPRRVHPGSRKSSTRSSRRCAQLAEMFAAPRRMGVLGARPPASRPDVAYDAASPRPNGSPPVRPRGSWPIAHLVVPIFSATQNTDNADAPLLYQPRGGSSSGRTSSCSRRLIDVGRREGQTGPTWRRPSEMGARDRPRLLRGL